MTGPGGHGSEVMVGPLAAHEREKARAVGVMFDAVSRRYDLLNRVMSAGQDGPWRRTAVASMRLTGPGPLLDIGAGTGDLSFELHRQHPDRDVVGVDLSAGMLTVAARKRDGAGEQWLALARADTLRLPFRDNTFAGAATAFTLRNVADTPAALREIRRVLKDGAPFACLEIIRPDAALPRALFGLYFRDLLPRLTGLISGQPGAYRYLPESVERFLGGRELLCALNEGGFERTRMRRFWPGAVMLHTGRARKTAGGARP